MDDHTIESEGFPQYEWNKSLLKTSITIVNYDMS